MQGTHYHFTPTPCGKWDVEHGRSGYDGRFTTPQARSFARQLMDEGNLVFLTPEGGPVRQVADPESDIEPLRPGWRA